MILYQGMSDGGELFNIPLNVFANSFASKLSTCAAFLGKKIKTDVWHQSLGHPSEEVLATMLKDSNILVSKDSCQSICSSCIEGKMSRQSFHIIQSSAGSLFERIHSDVWGPAPKQSIEWYGFYIRFVDEYLRFVWIFPMLNKSDAFPIFLANKGIVHMKSCPYTSQQNGIAERKYRRIVETVIALMTEANLP